MRLFSPLTIGQIRVPNRIAMTALPSGRTSTDGLVSSALAHYYRERAHYGAGLVVIEALYPHPPEPQHLPHLGIYSDSQATALRTALTTIRTESAVVIVMIDQPLPIAHLRSEELSDTAGTWFRAAQQVYQSGADGVMFSCADGGPFAQLLSPLSNKRTDEHGAGLTGRMRLLLELVERVRALAGKKWIIGMRLNVEEFTPGGLTLQDARVIAKRLVSSGVSLLEVCAANNGATPIARFPGWRVPLAASIKAIVDVPVMVGGLLADAELADSVIQEGSADLVALGEVLRAEPRWPQYARAHLNRIDTSL